MTDPLLVIPLFGASVVVTGWKIIGWTGALCFTARWFVQAYHRMRTRTSEVPTVFWWISLLGAGMTLSYFVFGKNDSVGIIQNLFPMTVAVWNLALDWKHRRDRKSQTPTG